MRWSFSNEEAKLEVEKVDDDQPYWFLYEGPIASRWAPNEQYFATDTTKPIHEPLDYFKNQKLFSNWRWVYFGDESQARVLSIVHEQQDTLADTFSHLGNSELGINSQDGMVVFGFGRAEGTRPVLTGKNSFRIGFIERSGSTPEDYEAIKKALN